MKPPAAIELAPRVELGALPTPLHALERLSEEVGVEIWVKRDDIGSPGLAGNKVRKLEYVLGEARRVGADTLITTGAAQSNSARAAATAARVLGMNAILLLTGEPPDAPTGNLLLDWLVGAEIRFVGDVGWARLDELVMETAEEVRSRGKVPVAVPVGCSSPLGTLGMVAGYFELLRQLDDAGIDPRHVYHASTSGGTHAGLVLGRAIAGRGPRPRAVSAGRLHDDPVEHHHDLATKTASMVAADHEPLEVDIQFGYEGSGYGVPSPEANVAIRRLARTEGILCDPVYSGKGMASLLGHIEKQLVLGPVVFWHTGGWQALFHPPLRDSLLS